MAKKSAKSEKPKPKSAKGPVKYEPPKLTRFEKLERLIVAGE
jgi:hypothetical protein